MRVTGRMLRQKILNNVQMAMDRLQFAQTQMATGKRILKPSDDPLDISKALKTRALLADNRQYQKNIGDALDWIDNTEPAVDEMVSVIAELKEVALEGASDTKSEYERSVLAHEVDGLIERLISLANSSYAGKYVFAGTHTLTAPYAARSAVSDEAVSLPDLEWTSLGHARITGGSVAVTGSGGETYAEGIDYEIDYAAGAIRRLATGSMDPAGTFAVSYETDTISGVDLVVPDTGGGIRREVAPAVHEQINIGGEEILASGTDVFDLMARVKTSLFRNQGTEVHQALDEIEAAFDQVTHALGKYGVRRNSFELTQARLQSEMVNFEAMVSNLEDADLAEVIVRFQTEQMAYESALAAASEIMNTSLINFIR